MITLPILTLRTALTGLAKVAPRRSTLPILQCVQIERRDGAVQLTANNLDQGLTYTYRPDPEPITKLARTLAALRWARDAVPPFVVPVSALQHAAKHATSSITLAPGFPARPACPAVAAAPAVPGRITWDSAAGSVAQPFDAPAAEDFPPVPSLGAPILKLGPALREAVIMADAFASRDATRHVLNGVLLDADPQHPRAVVATDGRRLFLRPAPELKELPRPLIVPCNAIAVLRLAALMAQEWQLAMPHKDVDHFSIQAGPWTLYSKGVDGNYPNYRHVITADVSSWMSAAVGEPHRQLLVTALKHLPEAHRSEAVHLCFYGDHLRLRCPEREVEIVIPGIRTAAPLVIALNRHFLREMFATGPGTLFLQNDQSPLQFHQSDGRLHVLMPMRPPEAAAAAPGNPVAAKSAAQEAA